LQGQTLRRLEGVAERQLHLVRHGEVSNPDGILYGTLPGFGLSALGVRMAGTAASDLVSRSRRVTALYSSPLQRTRESAAPIATAFGLSTLPDERIIEPWNRFEGRRLRGSGGALRDPRTWFSLRNPFEPSWGEPYRHIANRMLAAMADAWDSVDDGDVVLVSHQLPIWTTHRAVAGARLFHDPRSRVCALSSITSFDRVGTAFREVGYSDPTEGLQSLATDIGAV
jgi:broad specificity phosphatase PhoE